MPYTELIVKKAGDIGKTAIWELHERIEWTDGIRKLIIDPPFQTNFASVPRLPIIFMKYGDTAHIPATFHDYGYRKDSLILEDGVLRSMLKEEVDHIFFVIMLETGMDHDDAEDMYKGVRVGGESSWHQMNVNDKLIKEDYEL